MRTRFAAGRHERCNALLLKQVGTCTVNLQDKMVTNKNIYAYWLRIGCETTRASLRSMEQAGHSASTRRCLAAALSGFDLSIFAQMEDRKHTQQKEKQSELAAATVLSSKSVHG
jgi:hypothetical protein